MIIIDSHCHLNYEPLVNNVEEVVNRAKKLGVTHMLTISTKDDEFPKILEIIKKQKNVYGTYGIHPHEAKSHLYISTEKILSNLKKDKKIIGIGETGLDFYYNNSDKKSQIELFQRHIEAASETKIPLIIHSRSAEKQTFDILKKSLNKDIKFLVHCFTGSKEFAHKLLDIGAYISASGIVTFKNSKELAKTLKNIPNDRILIENDSPYLSPEPLRGKTNEPGHIIHTLDFLAKLKGVEKTLLAQYTSQNFFNLFGALN